MNIHRVIFIPLTGAYILTCTFRVAHKQDISQLCFCHMIELGKLY